MALSYGLDALHAALPYIPKDLASYLPASTDITRASYYLLSIGLVTAVPAVMSGGQQAFKMISAQGMWEADGKTMKPKVQTTITHAVMNDLVLFASGYSWWCRRQAAQNTLAGKLGVGSVGTAAATYAPEFWQVALSILTMGLLFFAANLGGTLTYNYGVGFSAIKTKTGKKSQ